MATCIGDIRNKVRSRIQDGSPGGSSNPAAPTLTVDVPMACDLDLCILAAREEYEKARPYQAVVLLTGTGAFNYAISLFQVLLPASNNSTPNAYAAFTDGFSDITEILYPFDSTVAQQNRLETDEYAMVRTSAGLFLQFQTATPTAPQQFQVAFTTPHVVDVTHFSILSCDEEAFCDLCAAYGCYKLAAYYRQASAAAVQGDTVNYLSKAEEYVKQGKVFRDSYKAKMFAPPDGPVQPASSVGFFDSVMATDVDRYFSHGRRYR